MKDLKMVLFALALGLVSAAPSTADLTGHILDGQTVSAAGNDQDIVGKSRTKQMYAGKIEGGMYEKFSGQNIPVRPKLLWFLDCKLS